MLEHHGNAIGRAALDRLAVHQQLAVAQFGQPGDTAQKGGLAAAGRPDDAHDLVALDLQRKLMKGDNGAIKEELGRVVGNDGGLDCRLHRTHTFPQPEPDFATRIARLSAGQLVPPFVILS